MARLLMFTTRATSILHYALQEAKHFYHRSVGSEHLLLALTQDHDGVAGRVLHALGVTPALARSAVAFSAGYGEATTTAFDLELAASAKQVLADALDARNTLNHHFVGTEHLLLGVVRTATGAAAGVLDSMGVTREQVRAGVLREVRDGPSPDPPRAARSRQRRALGWSHGAPAAGYRSPLERIEVLKVSTRSRPSAVAGAIAGMIRESGRVEVQSIGGDATQQAIKAVAIARAYLTDEGIDIYCVPSFIDVAIDDEERTAIKLVIQRRDGPTSGTGAQDVTPPTPE